MKYKKTYIVKLIFRAPGGNQVEVDWIDGGDGKRWAKTFDTKEDAKEAAEEKSFGMKSHPTYKGYRIATM